MRDRLQPIEACLDAVLSSIVLVFGNLDIAPAGAGLISIIFYLSPMS
jgi:hypothetical protein